VNMAKSTRAFLVELYEEFLQEASFLYEQRLRLLEDPQICWNKVGEFEERFVAYIDGLVVGEDLAVEVCKKQAQKGDFGELHAAVRVFCRQGQKNVLFSTLLEVDLQDSDRIRAATDALKHELPVAWYSDIRAFAEFNPALAPMLMAVLGYRRVDIRKDLQRILRSGSLGNASELMWTAGRIRDFGLQTELSRYLRNPDANVQSAAALALLRLGDDQALRHSLNTARIETWQLIPFGLAGGRPAARILLESSTTPKIDDDWLIALGILGDLSAVQALLNHLSDPKTGAAAAASLQLITGAGLFEQVFIPDEIEEDEFLAAEPQKSRQEPAPLREGMKPLGVTVVRLSQNPGDWAAWWAENEPTFDHRVRYRHGTPYSPASLLRNLECKQTPHRLRQLAYEELVIRYGMDVTFEADMFVSDQMQALAHIDQWIQANNSRFREGTWYFHGNLVY
jgi:uncharacterized protein (TIGR02270 family)